jgi:hypothetical protein
VEKVMGIAWPIASYESFSLFPSLPFYEGEARRALPGEGATQAPLIDGDTEEKIMARTIADFVRESKLGWR